MHLIFVIFIQQFGTVWYVYWHLWTISGPTWATHANLLQVFILDVVKVWESSDVELIPDPQEVLLQLDVGEQLQQPLSPLLTLHLKTQTQITMNHVTVCLKKSSKYSFVKYIVIIVEKLNLNLARELLKFSHLGEIIKKLIHNGRWTFIIV